MSHWGARTGWSYEAQRVSFLREMYKTERRHRENALSPREDPAIQALARAMAMPPVLPATGARIFGVLPTLGGEPACSEELPVPSEMSPRRQWPAVSTQSQVSFRAPDNDFLERFKAGRDHGKMHDKETDYREKGLRCRFSCIDLVLTRAFGTTRCSCARTMLLTSILHRLRCSHSIQHVEHHRRQGARRLSAMMPSTHAIISLLGVPTKKTS